VSTLNPDHLLEQAERLVARPAGGQPRQADIRRAISTAYYAVFHAALTAVADEFIGATRRGTPAYGLAYRSIDHRWLRDLCEDVKKPTPPAKYTPYLPAKGIGPNVIAFATELVALQEKRHAADYDAVLRFRRADAEAAIKSARAALRRLEKAPSEKRNAFLTLLAFPPRR
jgi:uncharacterized protein (UPF0332 family)